MVPDKEGHTIMITRQTLDTQNFILGAVGGTLPGTTATHRPQDILCALLDGLATLREATKGAARPNMRADIDSAVEKLAEEYPESITSEGIVTDAVADQANALVGDPDVLDALAVSSAAEAAWSAFDEIIGRGDCYLDGEDGVGVYAISLDDYDY
jgi:hypothetical protein